MKFLVLAFTLFFIGALAADLNPNALRIEKRVKRADGQFEVEKRAYIEERENRPLPNNIDDRLREVLGNNWQSEARTRVWSAPAEPTAGAVW